MYARVLQFLGVNDLTSGVPFVRDEALPVVKAQHGYRGLTASVDRSENLFGILTLWETEADREASFGTLAKVRDEGLGVIGGDLTVENFEQVAAQMSGQPVPGSALMITRTSQDPGKLEANIEYFKSEVMPRIAAGSGFLALRNLVNRSTGEGVVGTVWTDQDAMQAAMSVAEPRRAEAEARGVTFHGTSFREMILIHQP